MSGPIPGPGGPITAAALVAPSDRKKPSLYQLARIFRWAGRLVAIAIVIFLVTVVYSAVHFTPTVQVPQNQGNGGIEESGQGGYSADYQVNVSNPGWYVLTMQLGAVATILNGAQLAAGDSGVVSIDPGNTEAVQLSAVIATTILEAQTELFTRSVPLVAKFWINGTYADVFSVQVEVTQNVTWGAPFQGLAVVPGMPVAQGANTEVPLTINFTNRSPGPDDGTFSVQVVQSGGTDCGTATQISPDTPSGAVYDETTPVDVPNSCNLASGAEVETTYTEGSLTVPLPPESIP